MALRHDVAALLEQIVTAISGKRITLLTLHLLTNTAQPRSWDNAPLTLAAMGPGRRADELGSVRTPGEPSPMEGAQAVVICGGH